MIAFTFFDSPAHHNLNNQQLKLFSKRLLKSVIPAHHNLRVSVAGCLGFDVLERKTERPSRNNSFQLLVV
jgi:hypothetical protein